MTLNDMYDQFKAQNKRTGHNIGFQSYFTSAPGMMLPVDHRIMSPSETIQWGININTITQPLVRPAMLDVVQKVDCFFVPLSMILTYFPNMMFQTNDIISSATLDRHGENPHVFPLCGYHKDFASWLHNINQFNIEPNIPMQEHYDVNRFDSFAFGSYRLGMHLGLNPNSMFAQMDWIGAENFQAPSHAMNLKAFPYQLAAYQAVYQNWYRDDEREPRCLKSYQLDYFKDDAETIPLFDLYRLRYHQRERDYYSSLRVSPVMSTLNMLYDSSMDELSAVRNFLDSSYVDPSKPDGTLFDSNRDYNKNLTQYDGLEHLSTGSLRSLFAVEKFNRIMGRARKNYDSQVMAHFGYNVPRDIKHEISFLGSFTGNIGINTVMSTSATQQAELGERAGSGQGKLTGKPIKFTAPCHGVFIAIYYSVPRFSYTEGFNYDKINQITGRLDFPWPEYDRLGDQPMYGFEALNNTMMGETGIEELEAKMYVMPLGWQRRYEQYKRKYSRHSLAFYRPTDYEGTNVWSPWVLGANPYDSLSAEYGGTGSDFQFNDITPNYDSFFVSPHALDNLFVMKYKTTDFTLNEIAHPWLLFQRDPFMHAATINAKLVSFMSVTGEPSLDSMF